MSRLIDLTGQRFGMLTVLSYAGKNKHKHTVWLCKCDCGNEKIIDGQHLKTGNTKSCGCQEAINRSLFGTRSKRAHQMKNTRIYHIWQGAKTEFSTKTINTGLTMEAVELQCARNGRPVLSVFVIGLLQTGTQKT